MKKIMLSVALLAAVVMTSCGKTACDCRKEAMDLMSEAGNAIGDEAKTKEYEAKAEALSESCKDFTQADYEKCD
jgi:hypothetical protein